jgi:ergothioneine biosynthesis protein EgtB
VLFGNRFDSAYRPDIEPSRGAAPELTWTTHDGGIVDIGHNSDSFALGSFSFDNEHPRHQALLQPHRIADRLVTNGEWLEFIADGGYRSAGLWLSDGWRTVNDNGWDAPLYWDQVDGRWQHHTLSGWRDIDPNAPVVHVSYYEADAFARWAGARLPTEFEWEHAAPNEVDSEANLLPSGQLHPRPAPSGCHQFFGDVWEWTSSAYAPYPGFVCAEGAVGEYNGKFMIDQQVLRGGACVTPGGHVRSSYRNFFPAHSRWMFGGLRLAADASE